MAYITKRGKGNATYAVIYSYLDPQTGHKVSKWESGFTKETAERRRDVINLEQKEGRFIIPSDETVSQFFARWLPLQAMKNKWSSSHYRACQSYVLNHINPYIGQVPLQKLTTQQIDQLYLTLFSAKKGQYVKGVRQNWTEEQAAKKKPLSSTTVKEVHDLLHVALETAVEWKLLACNPVPRHGPKKAETERTIWEADTVARALQDMEDDPLLHLLVHITFIGSLREGEAVGIQCRDVNFDFKEIGAFSVNKMVQRLAKNSVTPANEDTILLQFPEQKPSGKSLLVLKKLKTRSSERIIFMTPQLKEEIRRRMEQIKRDKERLGDRYFDFGLLLCQPNGRPIEPAMCYKMFRQWQARMGGKYPSIVFHGLRHSSSTYKLEISEGDIKSVQGDTGHQTANVLMNTYAHIRNQPRIQLTQKIAQDFYGKQEAPPAVEGCGGPSQPAVTDQLILAMIKNSPQLQQKLLGALLANNA